MCAVSLSPSNAVFVSMTSFAVPSSLVLIISLAIIVATRRRNDGIPTPGKIPAGEFHDYDVIDEIRNAPARHVTTTGTGTKTKQIASVFLSLISCSCRCCLLLYIGLASVGNHVLLNP